MDMCAPPAFPYTGPAPCTPGPRRTENGLLLYGRPPRSRRVQKTGAICTRTETDASSQSRPDRSRFRAFRSHLDTQPAPHGILRHSPFPGVSLFDETCSHLHNLFHQSFNHHLAMIDEHLSDSVTFRLLIIYIADSIRIKLDDVGIGNGHQYRRVRHDDVLRTLTCHF